MLLLFGQTPGSSPPPSCGIRLTPVPALTATPRLVLTRVGLMGVGAGASHGRTRASKSLGGRQTAETFPRNSKYSIKGNSRARSAANGAASAFPSLPQAGRDFPKGFVHGKFRTSNPRKIFSSFLSLRVMIYRPLLWGFYSFRMEVLGDIHEGSCTFSYTLQNFSRQMVPCTKCPAPLHPTTRPPYENTHEGFDEKHPK